LGFIKMHKLLVTGGTGFIGRHCLELLPTSGEYEIHATCHGNPPLGLEDVHWHRTDLLHDNAIDDLMAKIEPSHLLHLAWYTVPGKCWSSIENFRWVAAGLSLIRSFARHGGRRAVFAGSCAEYDWQYGYCTESTTPCTPVSVYGTCKHSLQLMANKFFEQEGLSYAWGRVFFLYGPHEPKEKLVAYVAGRLLCNEKALCSPGDQMMDYLYVKDVAGAFLGLLDSDVRGPVNICSGTPLAIKKIVRHTAAMLNKSHLVELGAVPPKEGDPLLLVGNNKKILDGTHWCPQYDLAKGLKLTIQWWQAEMNAGRDLTL